MKAITGTLAASAIPRLKVTSLCPGSVEQKIKFIAGYIWAGRIAALMVY